MLCVHVVPSESCTLSININFTLNLYLFHESVMLSLPLTPLSLFLIPLPFFSLFFSSVSLIFPLTSYNFIIPCFLIPPSHSLSLVPFPSQSLPSSPSHFINPTLSQTLSLSKSSILLFPTHSLPLPSSTLSLPLP